jgi:hypothetical protein
MIRLFGRVFQPLFAGCCFRYERSKDRTQRGSSVVQRHVAMQEEVDIAEGKGRLVSSMVLVTCSGRGKLDLQGWLGQTGHRRLLCNLMQVPPEQLDDPGILGQTQQRADHFL